MEGVQQQLRALPPEIYDHCVILLEEKMYSQAISMLQSLANPSQQQPAVPPPSILSLLSTVAVHPSTTSRSTSADQSLVPLQALSYIRTLTSAAKPGSARFSEAFCFRRAQDNVQRAELPAHGNSVKRRKLSGPIDLTHSSSPSASSGDSTPQTSSDSEDHSRINNPLASSASVYNIAEGFWHTVGWAFNCSVRHPERWSYWKPWLENILDVLTAEFDVNSTALPGSTRETLGSSYLREPDPASRSGLKKMLRAVFANGSSASMSEFHEIWPGETKPPKEKDRKELGKSMKRLDLDQGHFGDYWDDDMSDTPDSEATTKPGDGSGGKRTSGRTMREPGKYHVVMNLEHGLERTEDGATKDAVHQNRDPIEDLGGVDATNLRRRFIAWVAASLRQYAFSKTSLFDYLELTAEHIRAFPTSVVTLFITPTPGLLPQSSLDPNNIILARLHMALLNLLISNDTIPKFQDRLPLPGELIHYYLPYKTNSSSLDDIVKTTLILHTLVRLLKRHNVLDSKPELLHAAEVGMVARQKKADTIQSKHRIERTKESEVMMTLAIQSQLLEASLRLFGQVPE